MLKTKSISAFLLPVILGTNTALACTDTQIIPAKVTGGSMMTLTCKTDVEVKQIAVEIIGEQWNGSYPYLYDDGTHGDQKKQDKNYSLSIKSPTATGTYTVKFFRILPDQTELESKPLTFTVK